MHAARLALLFGLGCSALVACRTPAPPAAARPAGSSELVWQTLPAELDPSSGALPALTLDDGRALTLRAIEVRATVISPIASTELELEFDELPKGQSSATFSVDLPQAAALSRFAVYDQGGWREAVPASPERAPSSLPPTKPVFEIGKVRNFSVRVLARPGQRPRLLVGYVTSSGEAEAPYRVRLAGLPRIDSFDATIRVLARDGARTHHLERKNFVPDRDFSIPAQVLGEGGDFQALRAGKYGVARLLPQATKSNELTFLVDTSASQPLPLPKLADSLRALSEALADEPGAPLLTVIGFDQEVRSFVVRSQAPLSANQLAPLAELGRLGGTDLTHALAATVPPGLPRRHLVILSDFENTVGPVEGERLSRRDLELTRLDVLVPNAAAEAALLEKQRARGGTLLDVPSVIARFDDAPKRAARQLLQPTPGPTSVVVKGAKWASPSSDDSRQEFTPGIGESIWVFAEYEGSEPLEVELDGKAKASVRPVEDRTLSALLKQVVGGVRIDQLLMGFSYGYDDPSTAAEALSEVSRLAREYGLITPLSSFVVEGAPSGGEPQHLAGRIVDTTRTRLVRSMTMMEAAPPERPPVNCPELVGFSEIRRERGDCPPLYVDFAVPRQRLIADVSFAGGSAPAKGSDHLDAIAGLLTLRPELVKLAVKAASQARAEGVVRYLVGSGVAPERLTAERLLEGEIPPRKPTPQCKKSGRQVVLEVREMSLDHLHRRIAKKPLEPTAPPKSALAIIDRRIRESWRSQEMGRDQEAILRDTQRWVAREPANPLAYVALGNALYARHDHEGAARAYGTLFDLRAASAGLDLGAALRLQQPGGERRAWDLAMQAFRARWQNSARGAGGKADVEGSRAFAYAELSRKFEKAPGGMIYEAAENSSIVANIEMPLIAHLALNTDPQAHLIQERLLPRWCSFPMQSSVLGAVLSWEDKEAELEVEVSAVEEGFTYDSVLTDRTPSATLKWLPLPEDDDDYPIELRVRAERLGKNGYAFGVLRVLNYNGRGRVSTEVKPFVVSQVGERVLVHAETILQRPQ